MLTINPSEVIWTILCFFALYFLLKRFLYTPLTRFMDERKQKIQDGLDEERKAADELREGERLLEQHRREDLSAADQQLREEKRQEEERRSGAIREARQAAAGTGELAGQKAEAMRREAQRQIADDRAELAASLSRRLLDDGLQETR